MALCSAMNFISDNNLLEENHSLQQESWDTSLSKGLVDIKMQQH